MKIVRTERAAYEWLCSERGKDRLKVLSGLRGGGKRAAVDAYLATLRRDGVDGKNIIRLDFEGADTRHISSHKDVKKLLTSGAEGKMYLVLDEVTWLLDFEMLMIFLFGFKEYDLLITTSNSRLLTEDVKAYFAGRISECRLMPDATRECGNDALKGTWGTLFLRDVLGGHVLADASALERLAEFLSDHRGELFSRRRISQEFSLAGQSLSANTVQTYLGALVSSFLLEEVPMYDMFTCEVVRAGSRFFWTDPVLRRYRFGDAPEHEKEREAYSNVYLRLREQYGRVYCERDKEEFSNFIVFNPQTKRPEIIEWKSCL